MSENLIQPWFAVNELMESAYRDIVVRIAMQHLPTASKDLQTFARTQFSTVVVHGFRSFERADAKSATLAIVREMPKRADVTTAVIGLWGEAMQPLIETLQHAAEAQGLTFQSAWTWRQAQEGYQTSGQVEALEKVCDELAQGKAKPESDHLRLAVLWLSRALERKDASMPEPAPGDSVQNAG